METTPLETLTPAVPTPELLPTQTRGHHRYGPSKMNYLDDCAAFTSRSGTSEAAEQGTFLHDIMEKLVTNVVKGRAKTTLEQVADWVTKTHELSDEEVDYLRFCCKRSDTFLTRNPTAVHTEISVAVTAEDGVELNHGYLDVLFIFANGVGILQDYKFGWEPVRPATDNLQGFNYALGCFQKFRGLNRIGVEFIQPKLNWVTSHVFERTGMFELFQRLNGVIERAEFVKAHPEDAQRYMKPGHYCKYCDKAGGCAVLANHRALAASKYQGLPVPTSFKGLELTSPEDVALARYWVDVIETGLKEVKAKAFEMAEQNGGSIRCTLPSGEQVVYEMQERSSDRCLGSAPEVAEALKEFVSPQEILGAAELAITKLETIAKNALVEMARGRGEKLTKKAAWEQVQSTLEAQGLLSRPDSKIRFLKLKKETKQIADKE
jgi:hypothetical protein